MNTLLILTFAAISQNFNLPPGLLSSLCYVESQHNVETIHKNDGGSDSLGICQIKLHTARSLGFTGTRKELMSANINIYYAGKYLRQQLDRYKQNQFKAIAAYNAGSYKKDEIGATMNWHYVKKVVDVWSAKK